MARRLPFTLKKYQSAVKLDHLWQTQPAKDTYLRLDGLSDRLAALRGPGCRTNESQPFCKRPLVSVE